MACPAVLSNYLINKLLNHITNQSTFTPPTTIYLALFTAAPSPSGGGTEVAGGSYARQAITWGAVASQLVSNSGSITFPTATGNWGTVTYWVLFDAVSSGNMLMFTAPNTAVTVNNGSAYPTITSGNLQMAFQ